MLLGPRERRGARGLTLVETLVTLIVGVTLTVIAVPLVQSTLTYLRLNAAVASATAAIGTTRYQAIMHGYPYTVSFDPATFSYQVSSLPPGSTQYGKVGGPVPLSGSSGMTLSAPVTFQFQPNGIVQGGGGGAMSFSITYMGNTKTILVSRVGNVKVTP